MIENKDGHIEKGVSYRELTKWERRHVKEAVKNIVNYVKNKYVRGTEIELRIGRDASTLRAYRKIADNISEKKHTH